MGGEPDVAAVVDKVLDLNERRTIGIPRILIVPKGEVTSGYHDFDLDLSGLRHRPLEQPILLHELRTGERTVLEDRGLPTTEERPADHLIARLIDYDDICYDEQADLLYKLAGQVLAHLRSYLPEEDEVLQVLKQQGRTFVELIHAQMQAHRWTRATEFDISASRGFEMLKPVPFSAPESEKLRDFRVTPTPLHDIPKLIFGGFARCLYPEQKFGSDPERRFAMLLEDEPAELQWFKPARDQLRIHYRGDQTYEPDFVVETATHKYLCEPKKASEIDAPDVRESSGRCRMVPSRDRS